MQRLTSLVGQLSRLSVHCASSPLPMIRPPPATLIPVRPSTFFVKLTAQELWKGVTSVSNAGRKRGRASGGSRKRAKDLNRGQILGGGKINMVWPGLNAPIIRGKELIQQAKLPDDPEREERLAALRQAATGFRNMKLSPLERGWCGTRAPGRSAGRPDPVGTENFENFTSTIVELKVISNMRGPLGLKRRQKAVVIVGNGEGLMGFAAGKSTDTRSAMRKAKNLAIKHVSYFERFENHTVLHDFFTEYGSAKLIVKKKQHGHGLVCHRILKEVCKAIGITDIHIKLDKRSSSTLCLIRAFLLGLEKQRSHQSVADEKGLHVVEFRQEHDWFPKVIASPTGHLRTEEEISANEELDYDAIMNEGRVILQKKKPPPFYTKLPSWEIHLRKTDNLRNQREVRLRMMRKYGTLKSFLNDREAKKEAQTQD